MGTAAQCSDLKGMQCILVARSSDKVTPNPAGSTVPSPGLKGSGVPFVYPIIAGL